MEGNILALQDQTHLLDVLTFALGPCKAGYHQKINCYCCSFSSFSLGKSKSHGPFILGVYSGKLGKRDYFESLVHIFQGHVLISSIRRFRTWFINYMSTSANKISVTKCWSNHFFSQCQQWCQQWCQRCPGLPRLRLLGRASLRASFLPRTGAFLPPGSPGGASPALFLVLDGACSIRSIHCYRFFTSFM